MYPIFMVTIVHQQICLFPDIMDHTMCLFIIKLFSLSQFMRKNVREWIHARHGLHDTRNFARLQFFYDSRGVDFIANMS